MVTRRSQTAARIGLVAGAAVVAVLALACGSSSGDGDPTPTAIPLPTIAADGDTTSPPRPQRPAEGPPGEGVPRQALAVGGASEEFAAFLGIPLEQLESELGGEGATPSGVAEAHGRSREELRFFFIEEARANLGEAVSAGTVSQEEADSLTERLESVADRLIDGTAPFGEGRQPPLGADATPVDQ